METRWMYRTSGDLTELREAAKDVCVIPMGCIEKHGLHLPLGTDIMQASALAYDASQKETVCVAPDYIFGDIPPAYTPKLPVGSIGVSVELRSRFLEEYCDMIARSGFRKILIYNAHGGNNPWLATFLRSLAGKRKEYAVATIYAGLPVPHKLAEILFEKGSGSVAGLTPDDEALLLRCHEKQVRIGHAGYSETSFVMHYYPEAVHLDRLGIESGANLHKTDYLKEAGIKIRDDGWDINFPNAFAADDPVGCNERIAAAAAAWESDRLAGIYKLIKEDKNLLRWQEEFIADWKNP